MWSQFLRFWSFEDRAVQTAVAGMLLLAISCGSLGCFIVLRRLSLLGDSLGHAVLPGVCLGFLVAGTKNLYWIFGGAVVAALVASWLIGLIERFTRLKPDVALGLVLSGFFGFGLVLLKRLEKTAGGGQAGLNQFLFGQAAAINERDLWLMGGLTVVIVLGVLATFKELAVTTFDQEFAVATGVPGRAIHFLLMTLTALAIVVALQAVGVVLLSALLITPAATALLLTDRLKVMVLLSITIAAVAGVLGLNLSFLERDLPTGPFVVLVLSAFFGAGYLFSPRYGIAVRFWRRRRRARRIQRENLLKSVYLLMAASREETARSSPPARDEIREGGRRDVGPPGRGSDLAAGFEIALHALARAQDVSPRAMERQLRPLVRHGWAAVAGDSVRLTDEGLQRAAELQRNYRLWELFLTDEVRLPADHTSRDAEDIEHLLTPELVRELEEKYKP